jgi:S-adenosylmethionine hydrolase
MAAGFALRRYWNRYPPGTVHVVVVDPGVGSERAAIAIEAGERYFVGPDNGVFTFIPPGRAVELPTPSHSSRTFHGRDVFAPAAAKLLSGAVITDLGKETFVRVVLEIPREPHVMMVDRFGNLITNVSTAGDVEIAGRVIRARRTYADVAEGELLTLMNSDGLLEIAVRNGSAAETLGVSRGAEVRLVS